MKATGRQQHSVRGFWNCDEMPKLLVRSPRDLPSKTPRCSGKEKGLFCNSGDAVFGALCWWRGRCGDLVSTGGCRRRLGYGQCRPYQAREDRQGQPVPRPPYGRRSKNLGGPQCAFRVHRRRHATHPTSRKLTAPFSLSLGGRPRQNDDAKSSCQNPQRHRILARSVLRPAPNLLLRSRGAGVGLTRLRRAP
jgi:hypothetical protein